MDKKTIRPIKLLLPGALVDRVDSALQGGLGGFRTRHDLVEEAIEYYLQELRDAQSEGEFELTPPDAGPAGNESRPRAESSRKSLSAASKDQTPEQNPVPPSLALLENNRPWSKFVRVAETIEDMAISTPPTSYIVQHEQDVSSPDNGPILGLHNRDWPTLKSLELLAQMTTDAPVPCEDFYTAATANGWLLAESLKKFESSGHGKLSALLPDNRAKAKAAENNFRAFALGWIKQSKEGEVVRTSGPLFSWSAAALTWQSGVLHIGLSQSGGELLNAMDGLSPVTPHSQSHASTFFNHISKHGIEDWKFFHFLLTHLVASPTRIELVESIKNAQESSESVAASLAQGYVARGREWGLVELKQKDGRYELTSHGHELITRVPMTDSVTQERTATA